MLRRIYDALRLNFRIFPGITQASSAEFLADYYARERAQQGVGRTLVNVLVWLGFQLYVPIRARKIARKWQRDDAWRKRATRWGRKHFVDPADIAAHEIEQEEDFATYQRRFEQIPVIRAMERDTSDHSPTMIDKARFQEHCEEHGLRVPASYAEVDDGRIEWRAGWNEGDPILLKPARGSGGYGVSIIGPADRAALDRELGKLQKGNWLAQEVMQVHPALADLALDALPTARIVTILDEDGNPEIVTSSIRFAVNPGTVVDNNHFGGVSALIDGETGELGKPMEIEGPGKYDVHPTTGGQVAGRIVPDWDQAKALAVEAHAKAFSHHVLIGWDIGFSNRGPVLIEANQRPNVRLTQRIEGKGIGAMRYGELVSFHLERAAREDGRSRAFLTKG